MLPLSRWFRNSGGKSVIVNYQAKLMCDSVDAAYQLAIAGTGLSSPPDFLVERDIQGRKARGSSSGMANGAAECLRNLAPKPIEKQLSFPI